MNAQSLFIYLFSFATRAGSPQQHMHANYCGPFLPNPPCQLSQWKEIGEYPEKAHDFRQSVDFLLFSHEDWVRVALGKLPLRLEPAALDVKGKCANHFASFHILEIIV